MIKFLVFLVFLFILFFFPTLRTIILHPFKVIFYMIYDIYDYFKKKKWRIFRDYGIYIYGGMYGQGKTLSISRYCHIISKKYDNVRFISNIDLKGVKYTKFEYFEQLMDSPQYDGECLIYVIDEIGSLMNSRNYKNNRINETQFLYTLNQIRKQNKTLLLASQRFGMTDKNFRQTCVYWIECVKRWRFVTLKYYDAYDIEFGNNPDLVKPIKIKGYFANNMLFNGYDTKQLVKDFKDKFDSDSFNPIIVESSEVEEYRPVNRRLKKAYRK